MAHLARIWQSMAAALKVILVTPVLNILGRGGSNSSVIPLLVTFEKPHSTQIEFFPWAKSVRAASAVISRLLTLIVTVSILFFTILYPMFWAQIDPVMVGITHLFRLKNIVFSTVILAIGFQMDYRSIQKNVQIIEEKLSKSSKNVDKQ